MRGSGEHLGRWRPGQDDDCSAEPSPRLPQPAPRDALQQCLSLSSFPFNNEAHSGLCRFSISHQKPLGLAALQAPMMQASLLPGEWRSTQRAYTRQALQPCEARPSCWSSRVPTLAALGWRYPEASSRRPGRVGARTPTAAPAPPQSARPPCGCMLMSSSTVPYNGKQDQAHTIQQGSGSPMGASPLP